MTQCRLTREWSRRADENVTARGSFATLCGLDFAAMNCPACGGALTPVDVSGLTIDVCQGGCAGIWFDQAELRSIDEPAAKAGEILVALAGKPQVTVNVTKRRRCPRCPDSVLMRHFYSAKRAVTVDECPTCAGTWLDGGELEKIRRETAALRHVSIAHCLITAGRVLPRARVQV